MKTRFIILALWLLVPAMLRSQTSPADSAARAQIKQIKLSEKYVYADAISRNSFDEAIGAAVEELRIQAAGFLSELGKEKKETTETLARVDSLCQHLQYNQMGMFKGFAYVSKNRLLGLEEQTPDLTAMTEEVKAEEMPVNISPDTPDESKFTDEKEFAIEEEAAEEKRPEESSEPMETTVSEPEKPQDIPAAPRQELQGIAPQETEPATATPTETPAEMPENTQKVEETATDMQEEEAPAETTQPAEALPSPEQRVLSDLLALDTYEGVMLYLNAMKEDGRLMYGKMSTLRSPQEAYLIIVKEGRLLTILDKGLRERRNLKTQQTENIQKYKGHAVIWLKVFE